MGDQRKVVVLCKWIHREVEMVVERGKPGCQGFLNPGKTGVEDPEWFSTPDGWRSEASSRLVIHRKRAWRQRSVEMSILK
jgi:hypothetical protein